MEHDQVVRAQDRVRMVAEAAGLELSEDRIPALAEAYDAARLMIAQLEPLAASVEVPAGAPYDPSWSAEGRRR